MQKLAEVRFRPCSLTIRATGRSYPLAYASVFSHVRYHPVARNWHSSCSFGDRLSVPRRFSEMTLLHANIRRLAECSPASKQRVTDTPFLEDDVMNIDKPVYSTEMARHWVSVRTLVRRVRDGLVEMGDTEADGTGAGRICDDELLHAIGSLSASLRALFDVEESEECSSQILDEHPQLTERFHAFHREHQYLAGLISRIEDLCDDEDAPTNWTDVERRFREFVLALTSHEHREALFLQDATSLDIGVGD